MVNVYHPLVEQNTVEKSHFVNQVLVWTVFFFLHCILHQKILGSSSTTDMTDIKIQ